MTGGLKELWRRGQRGWPASKPVAQFPNPPLLVAAGGWLVAALTDGEVHDFARAVFYVGLAVWAWLELVSGASGYRRVLGGAVLIFVLFGLARALGA